MSFLGDAAVARLARAMDEPDLTGTRYEMVGPLGRGGMGSVWEVRDVELGREVALKVLRADVSGPELADRLRQEARVLARLEHPGIVPVHDVGVLADGRVFYAMKRVRGERLDRHESRDELLPSRLRLFVRLCEAVAFAHAQGVLHRDLKPENVMVGPFGEVLVLDWGLARVLSGGPEPGATAGGGPRGGPRATDHGSVLGTPEYMAPEQLAGEEAGMTADVYGLGGILYFLAAGRPAFRDAEVRRADPWLTPPPLRQVAPETPKALAAIAGKALAASAADRYPSARELGEDVSRFLDALPVSAYEESLLEKAYRVVDRNRPAFALVAVYLLVRTVILLLRLR